jgi:hypothetical protein
MKLHAITPIVLALVLVMAGSAAATHFDSFTGGADCDGFWATGNVYFAKPTLSVEIFYEVNLMQGATTVKTATGSFMVYSTARDFNFSEAWGEELCGDYTVDGRFWFFDLYGDDEATITAAFTCDCDRECQFSSVEGGADCDGFTGMGSIDFGTSTAGIELFYEAILMQGATTVKTVNGSFMVYAETPDFNYSEAWGMDLCGDYTVEGRFYFTEACGSDSEPFRAAFTCDCEEDGCHFTPGYWKTHPEAWPVTTLTLGGISYDQAQLLAILNRPVGGDATIILAHHLIAAKLNVLNGASDSINDEIEDADDLLAMYPIGSNPRGEARTALLAVKDLLCAYNEMIMPGCDGYIAPVLDRIQLAPAAGEKTTWGDIKNIYK